MHLERLTLRNWCQHADRDITFSPGLTGIIGANGSGKSNLLGAIRWLLTGENPNVGDKLDNISQLTDQTERSFGRLQFSHAGVVATVTRHLRPAGEKSTLEIEGRPRLSGDKQINPVILEILGINNETINETVLVGQEDIFGFLDQTPAKRAAAFQRLFHTAIAADVYKDLGAHANKVQIPAMGVDRDAAEARLIEATNLQLELVSVRALFASEEQLERSVTDAGNVMTTFATQQERAATLATKSSELTELEERHARACGLSDTTAENVRVLQQARDGNKAAAEQAQAMLTNLEQYRRVETARQTLRTLQEQTRQELVALQQPAPPLCYLTEDAYQPQLDAITYKLQRAETLIDAFCDGVTECPTCGTSVATLGAAVAKARAGLPKLTDERLALYQQRKVSEEFEKASASYARECERLNGSIVQYDVQARTLNVVEAPATDEVQLRQSVQQQEEYTAAISEYTTTLRGHDREVEQLNGQITELRRQVTELSTWANRMRAITQAEADGAQVLHDELSMRLRRLRSVELEQAVNQRDVLNAMQTIDALQRVEREANTSRQWLSYVEDMRALVHHDAAPKFVSHRNLLRLQAGLNEHLAVFDTDFRVQATEGLSFEGYFTDGRRQAAERFSVGQKVILALAWRLALNLTFAADVGLLALDEPTAWLDKHHIRGFTPALTRLRTYAASRGLQCIIITHEDELAPLFDTVITL